MENQIYRIQFDAPKKGEEKRKVKLEIETQDPETKELTFNLLFKPEIFSDYTVQANLDLVELDSLIKYLQDCKDFLGEKNS